MGRSEQEPKKIALIGTSRVGKTIIFEYFRKSFAGNPNVAFVEEAARIFFRQNPQIRDRFSVDAQGKIQALALKSEQDAHQSGAKVILCDRSVIDAIVYVRSQGDTKGGNELLKRVEFWLPTYHKFILLDPAGVPYETDDIRQETPQTRHEFHDSFLKFFEETGILYELLSGTKEERISRVTKILEK